MNKCALLYLVVGVTLFLSDAQSNDADGSADDHAPANMSTVRV